jgi:hypothetical protein
MISVGASSLTSTPVWTFSAMPDSSKVAQAYFDSTNNYYGFDTKNVASNANGFVSIYIAPGANRIQLKYNKNGTLTTKNYTLPDETITNDSSFTDLCKFGRVCAGSIAFNPSTTTGTVGTLSASFKPLKWVRGVCRSDDINKWGKLDINPSTGAVTFQVPTTGLYYYAQIAYISAS